MKTPFALALLATLATNVPVAAACPEKPTTLRFGFYPYFQPVSYSADRDPAAPGFNVHLGYEADLLAALEATRGANLKFERTGIAAWDRIWLRAAGSRYDVVGGGITILEARTHDEAGKRAIMFTRGPHPVPTVAAGTGRRRSPAVPLRGSDGSRPRRRHVRSRESCGCWS